MLVTTVLVIDRKILLTLVSQTLQSGELQVLGETLKNRVK